MTCTSTATNVRERSFTGAADNRTRFSKGRRTKPRPPLHSLANHQSRGLEDVLHEMFLASRPRFLGMAYSILRNKEEAEDAVQDAFLSAFRHIRNFEGRSAFTTWFSRIVMNAALMILRKRTNSRIDSLPEQSSPDETPWIERIPASRPDPEAAYAKEETLHFIDALLGKMTPELRQAFTMTYFDEVSSEEAGALLGVSRGTFKSRLFRARRHLVNQAQRSLVAANRMSANSQLFGPKNDFQTLAARPAKIQPLQFALS